MKTVPIAKAKAQLSKLVEAARLGSPVTITIRGEPYAVLGPVQSTKINGSIAPQAVSLLPGTITLADLLRAS